MITGTCVSPGKAKGKIVFFRRGQKYSKKDIIVMDTWLTQDVLSCKFAGAVISKSGSIISHASIIARELRLPALVAANTSELKEGIVVEVDAAKEQVIIK